MEDDPTAGDPLALEAPGGGRILFAVLPGALAGAWAGRPVPTRAETGRVADGLAAAGARLVLAIGEAGEAAGGPTARLAEALPGATVRPVPTDGDGVIGRRFEDAWPEAAAAALAVLAARRPVGVVSLGFLGAAETVAARLLVETGLDGPDALGRVDGALSAVMRRLPERRRRLLGPDPWQREHVLALGARRERHAPLREANGDAT